MLQKLLDGSLILDLPVVTMFFFIAVFGFVLMRALSRRRGPHYERMARLPLEEGPVEITKETKEVRS